MTKRRVASTGRIYRVRPWGVTRHPAQTVISHQHGINSNYIRQIPFSLELPATVGKAVDMYSNGNSFNGTSSYANGYGARREAWWFRLMRPVPDPGR